MVAGSVVGRKDELAAVDEVLADARESLRLLIISGDAGIGKTTVWRAGIARSAAHGFRALSCRAAQAESRLSFAGLGDLLAPVEAPAFAALPAPQRRALEIALLRVEAGGSAPDPRAIATGMVSLISTLVADGPLLLALDDVQWLDRPTARALEFALRRVEMQPVAVLVTVRVDERERAAGVLSAVAGERVRSCTLGPLSLGALYELVSGQLEQAPTRPLLGSIARASGGNPFYALELVRALGTRKVGAANQPLPVPEDVRQLVARRLRRLPRRARDELLKASAVAQPTVSLLDHEALEPAIEAGLVRVGPDDGVEFDHPLFAGALYAGASRERRRLLHRELAEQLADVEERALHLALGTEGADEHVAAVLERGADLAHRRGAPEAAAELAEQAAQHTPADSAEVRWGRFLRAARLYFNAGERERAAVLVKELVAAAGCAPSLRAQALHLLAEIRGLRRPQAAIPLLEQAIACAGDDAALAAELETSLGLISVALLDVTGGERHLGRAVELAELGGETAVLAEATALRALAGVMTGRGVDGQALERALALEDPDREVPFQLRPSLNVAQAYEFTGQIGAARELLVGLRERVVARGEESDLPFVLVHLGATAFLAGELEAAERELDDALRVATLNGQEIFCAFALTVRAIVRAIRGDRDRSRTDAAHGLSLSERIGWPHGVSQARWAQAVLALSEDEPQAAADALLPIVAVIEQLGVYEWPIAMSLPDAIEALVATGDLEHAGRLTAALADWGRTFDRPWALALSGRCQALVAAATGDLAAAESAVQRALVEHERLPMPFELARTLLVAGRLQRRVGQRRAARESLERAVTLFEAIGSPPWADAARGEARRIGVRRAPTELTENEQLIAELAANGLTNREIAAQQFISRRTVEANLARTYRKLGIRSRAQLGAAIAESLRDTRT